MAKASVVYEDDRFAITKISSRGRNSPASYKIEAKEPTFLPVFHDQVRSVKLHLTVDDLFSLTEILDDICDHIEDLENQRRV